MSVYVENFEQTADRLVALIENDKELLLKHKECFNVLTVNKMVDSVIELMDHCLVNIDKRTMAEQSVIDELRVIKITLSKEITAIEGLLLIKELTPSTLGNYLLKNFSTEENFKQKIQLLKKTKSWGNDSDNIWDEKVKESLEHYFETNKEKNTTIWNIVYKEYNYFENIKDQAKAAKLLEMAQNIKGIYAGIVGTLFMKIKNSDKQIEFLGKNLNATTWYSIYCSSRYFDNINDSNTVEKLLEIAGNIKEIHIDVLKTLFLMLEDPKKEKAFLEKKQDCELWNDLYYNFKYFQKIEDSVTAKNLLKIAESIEGIDEGIFGLLKDCVAKDKFL